MWQNKSKKFYIIVSIAVVVVIAVLASVAFFVYKKKPAPEAGPKGFFFLTLKPRTTNATSSVYVYNLDDKILRFFNDKVSMNITGQGLPSGVGVTASCLYVSVGTADENIFQLYQVDMIGGFGKKQITNSRTLLKRHPEFSPDGQKIAFMAKEKLNNNAATSTPDDWSVYVTDLNGNEKLLGPGAYPQWSPDGKKVLVLRSDGLYLYDSDSEKQEGKNVWTMKDGGSAVLSMQIDVSRDGSMLAWSVPNDHQIILAKITSWEPLRMEEYRTIGNVFAFWPVFSPEAKYLAVITGEEKDKITINPRLKIYDMKNLEAQDIFDLKDYSVASMALTDWEY